MEITQQTTANNPAPQGWLESFRAHAGEHIITAVGFAIALLAILALLIQSLMQAFSGEINLALRYAMLGGLAGFAATALGALPALALRGIPQKIEDSMLGLAAGMMLAA